MRFLKGLTAAVAVSAMLGAASPAAAKIMKATIDGALLTGGDATGVLGIPPPIYFTGYEAVLIYDTSAATLLPAGVEVRDPFLSATLTAVTRFTGPGVPIRAFGTFDMAPEAGRVSIDNGFYRFEIDYEDQISVPDFMDGATLNRRHTAIFYFDAQGLTSLDTEGLLYVGSAPQYQDSFFSLVSEPASGGDTQYYNIIGISGLGRQLIFARFEDITDEYNAGLVPEPATWALMLVGFGAAGAALRRRRFALAR